MLCVPFALARETQAPSVPASDQAQPVVPATTTPAVEKAMTQELNAHAAGNSIDFLMEQPPLTQNTGVGVASSLVPATPAGSASPNPIVLPDLPVLPAEKTDEVAMLVSEQCSQNGNAATGTNSCERVYSNSHHATVLTQNANEGDELKHQTVIEEFDADNTLLYRKTIRHRVDYNYLKDQKAKEKELFDIIYQPAGKKTTRELMVYEYFLDTGKAKSLSWTQYKQIENKPKAELAYHAVMRYAADGSPERGLAEQWDHGRKIGTFMNWNRRSEGPVPRDPETWRQWEGWLQSVSLQAYLP